MVDNPCWPECKEILERIIDLKIDTVNAKMEEREKATILLAQNQMERQSADLVEKYVLRETHRLDIGTLRDQLFGPIGFELRIRALEQSRGVLDAKMWLVIIGLPLAVSVIIAVVLNVMMGHILKG